MKTELSGKVWGGGKPLLARWTTDWDCGYETNWWYCIKEAPYKIEDLPKSNKYHIRKALKKVVIERIDPVLYAREIYRVYEEAVVGYKNFVDETNEKEFITAITKDKRTYWGAFDIEARILVAYMIVTEKGKYVETNTAKFSKKYMNLRASTALYSEMLDYYLNKRGFSFVNSGERNINHETNTQEYKITTFGYRCAYCHLHVAYNPKIKWVVNLLYPFRRLLKAFNRFKLVHVVNAVLKMEEICRSGNSIR